MAMCNCYCEILMYVMIIMYGQVTSEGGETQALLADDITTGYESKLSNSLSTDSDVEQPKYVYRRSSTRGRGLYFSETFDYKTDEEFKKRWIISEAKKDESEVELAMYDGRWVVEPARKSALMGDKSLVLKSRSKHHAISVRFDQKFSFTGRSLIVQYEVKYQNGMDCGGAYVKLLTAQNSSNLSSFNDKTPYAIMFGPDQCGKQYKFHFIIQHRNPLTGTFEEKHANRPSALLSEYFTDALTHLYTLVLHSNNSFEMYIDQLLINSGSLLQDMTPPVNPEREIVDPNDRQPDDWNVIQKIPDPNAVKPQDWDQPEFIDDKNSVKPDGWLDDEPELIPNPTSNKPSDWDEEVDGAWEPPMINNPRCDAAPGCGEWRAPQVRNPQYRGEWSPPLIDNPNYKGKWKARMIPNPLYYEDLHPYRMKPVDALGLELWSVSGDVLFDNFMITDDKHLADLWATETWKVKHEYELEQRRAEMPFSQYLFASIDERPVASIVTLVLIVVPTSLCLIYCCQQYPNRPRPVLEHKRTDSPTGTQAGGVKPDSRGAGSRDQPFSHRPPSAVSLSGSTETRRRVIKSDH